MTYRIEYAEGKRCSFIKVGHLIRYWNSIQSLLGKEGEWRGMR